MNELKLQENIDTSDTYPVCFQSYQKHQRTPFEVCSNRHCLCRHCLTRIRYQPLCPLCRESINPENIKIRTSGRGIRHRRTQSVQDCRSQDISSSPVSSQADEFEGWSQASSPATLLENQDHQAKYFPFQLLFVSMFIDFLFFSVYKYYEWLYEKEKSQQMAIITYLFYAGYLILAVIASTVQYHVLIEPACSEAIRIITELFFALYHLTLILVLSVESLDKIKFTYETSLTAETFVAWVIFHSFIAIFLLWRK